MWASLTAKIINNIQVTVKNIHIRYEDKMSVPGVRDITILSMLNTNICVQHPFAAGITLAGFTTVSVDDKWEPAFIESTAGAIRKVICLQDRRFCLCADTTIVAGKFAITGGILRHRFAKYGWAPKI
jgi:vacuolar protein sorting-associated protein 13A/C